MQSLLIPPCQKEFQKQPKSIIPSRLNLVDLGEVDYLSGYAYQRQVLEGVIKRVLPETLIFCQHPPTFTTTRVAKQKNLLVEEDQLKKEGIDLLEVDRGGDITYHGPGQLIVYPVINLTQHKKDLKWFLCNLEQVAIDFLREFGIISKRYSKYTGVWVKSRKIASIGIGVRRWTSFHGMAINLNTDLDLFKKIRPCGLDIGMTSLQKETGERIDFNKAQTIVLQKFIDIFYKDKIE